MATSEAPAKTDKLVKKAKDCFKAAVDAEKAQREREREDLSFQLPENQWDPEARRYRKGTATAPGRPMLSVSLLSQPMQLIQNQAVQAKLGVEIHPVSEKSDPEVAEIKQGLYRRIERDSNAAMARLWALDRAKQCGRGWYRVNTQWDEDGDNEFDQEIVIERIFDQSTVYIDPAAQKADFSDAKWGLILSYVDVESFEEMYPDAEVPGNDADFKAWATDDPEWVKSDGDQKAVLVCEYIYKVIESTTVTKGKRKRYKDTAQVKIAHISAKEVLYEEDWNGHYIPLIPVIGSELQPFDGQRIWEGMVRKARDAQKFFNFSISTLVERMAMEPKAPWIGAEGQFKGHEDEWNYANVINQPTLQYVPKSHEGQLVPPPTRAQMDNSGMSMALMALDQARQFVQSATSVYAPSLGEMPQQQTAQSGRAIQALQQQSDAGTSQFLSNLATVSMPYEARVILDLMPSIYDRPGRIVQVLGDEDDPRQVMINKHFVPNAEGKPVPAQMGPPMAPGGPQVPQQGAKIYDLSQGKYTVSVSVGKSFQTRLQEGASEIGQFIQSVPPDLQLLMMPTYLRFRDFPGAKELADLSKQYREQKLPGLGQKEGEQPSPEQMKAQVQGMGQKIQEMGQQLQQATQAIQLEQAKQQATIMKAQLDAQTAMSKAQLDAETKMRIDAADNETKLAIAGQESKIDAILTLLKLEADQKKVDAENARTAVTHGHEAAGHAAQHAHEMLMARGGQAHEAQLAASGQSHDAAMNELEQPGPEEPEPPEETATEGDV